MEYQLKKVEAEVRKFRNLSEDPNSTLHGNFSQEQIISEQAFPETTKIKQPPKYR